MLRENAAGCALYRLLSQALQKWDVLPDNKLRFFRTGSYLKFNNEGLPPIASLYTLPGRYLTQ